MTVSVESIPVTFLRHPVDLVRSARRGEPVTFGVPLPRAASRDASGWLLETEDGGARPVQTRILEYWPDGSIRWMLVDARVDASEGAETRACLLAPKDPPVFRPGDLGDPVRIAVTPTNGTLTVDTGASRFVLGPGVGGPFHSVVTAGREVLDKTASGVTLTDHTGHPLRLTASRVALAMDGDSRVEIKAQLEAPDGPLHELQFTATFEFFAGLSAVRVALRVRNPRRAQHAGGFWDLGDPGSLLIKDLSLTIALAGGVGSVHVSPEPASLLTSMSAPVEIYQDSSGGENWQSTNHLNRERRVPVHFRGYRVRSASGDQSGLRATPVVSVRRDDAVVTAAVPHFWQNFPRALESDGRSITIRFFPGQFGDLHELQGGEQKTHTCVLAFGDDPVTTVPLDWTRAPLVPALEPSWHEAVETWPWLAPDDAAHAALVQPAVDGPNRFEAKREVIDEYGWRHFGEVYGDHEAIRKTGPMPLVSHYNNQYDTVGGLLVHFFRTGDPRWWTLADELAAHVIDIDIYHTTRDKWAYNHGLFWHTYHYGEADTATHRSYPRAGLGEIHGGGPSPQHVYPTGLLCHYFLTGRDASREAAVDLAQFVYDADDGSKTVFRWLSRRPTGLASASGSLGYHGPGRGSGNSLNALLDGYRVTGDARFLTKAESIIQRVVHPDEDVAANKLDDPENRWFYLMFLQALGKYLARKAELGQLDAMYAYARGALLRYARWMAEHEYPYLSRPERLEFPTESWAAIEARKSDVFVLAALHAPADERARFIERATFFFRNAVDTLATMPTRTLARPIIVLLTSGLLLPWYAAHPEFAAPAPADTPSLPARARFVPQRIEAVRRAKWLVTAGAASVVVTLTLWLLRGR